MRVLLNLSLAVFICLLLELSVTNGLVRSPITERMLVARAVADRAEYLSTVAFDGRAARGLLHHDLTARAMSVIEIRQELLELFVLHAVF